MRVARFVICPCLLGLLLAACSEAGAPFAGYQQEVFEKTPVTAATEKRIRLANPSAEEPQHIRVIGFDAGANAGGQFQIKQVAAAGRDVGVKDVVVPANGTLEITVAYAPKNLTTTRADWGGWETGQPTRYEPQAPKAVATNGLLLVRKAAAGGAPAQATHRALVILTYDHPQEGVLEIELVGQAVPGPNGEVSAAGGGAGPVQPGACVAGGTTACFKGKFGINLPGLMKGGTIFSDLSGPLPITIEGSAAQVPMNAFPPVLFVVKGNGPGQPLEGKPVNAISLVISGAPDGVATGTFDGASLQLNAVGFRIRLYLAEIALADADATTAPVDFLLTGLALTTAAPLTDGKLGLQIATTLSKDPAKNPLVDPFLSGAKVVMTLEGTLDLPAATR